MKTLYVKVRGTTYENRQSILERMHGNELCRIEPEPTNQYDPNALAVKVAFPSEVGGGVFHVGYVPRELAAEIAPLLEGENLMVEIHELTGGFELYDGGTANYGLVLRVEVPEEQTEN